MWKRKYAGCYEHKSGWTIERSYDGDWVLRNPDTGNVFDRMPTKKDLMRYYGTEQFSRDRGLRRE